MKFQYGLFYYCHGWTVYLVARGSTNLSKITKTVITDRQTDRQTDWSAEPFTLAHKKVSYIQTIEFKKEKKSDGYYIKSSYEYLVNTDHAGIPCLDKFV